MHSQTEDPLESVRPTPLTFIHYTLQLSDKVMLIRNKRKHSKWYLLSLLHFPQLFII
jgi:hypothetical protein